jgi:hypothetical protein
MMLILPSTPPQVPLPSLRRSIRAINDEEEDPFSHPSSGDFLADILAVRAEQDALITNKATTGDVPFLKEQLDAENEQLKAMKRKSRDVGSGRRKHARTGTKSHSRGA